MSKQVMTMHLKDINERIVYDYNYGQGQVEQAGVQACVEVSEV